MVGLGFEPGAQDGRRRQNHGAITATPICMAGFCSAASLVTLKTITSLVDFKPVKMEVSRLNGPSMVSFKQTLQFLQQINVHPVYTSGIQTHNRQNMSILP